MKNKVLIVDGNNLLHRVYWAAKKASPDNDAYHIFMFLRTLKSYIETFNPYKIIICWDFREHTIENFRKLLDENYKAQRDEDKNALVYEYMPIIMKIIESVGIHQINPKKLEADDIMFWLATVIYPNKSIIITSDTDMYQLLKPELSQNIIYDPFKKREITLAYLKDVYNVNNGTEFIITKALRGDKSDNLTGIKGIRSTKIANIISILSTEFELNDLITSGILKESEKNILEHNLKMMMFSMENIDEEELKWYEECLYKPKNNSKQEFGVLMKELEFWNIYKKIDYWYNTFNKVDYNDLFSSFFD